MWWRLRGGVVSVGDDGAVRFRLVYRLDAGGARLRSRHSMALRSPRGGVESDVILIIPASPAARYVIARLNYFPYATIFFRAALSYIFASSFLPGNSTWSAVRSVRGSSDLLCTGHTLFSEHEFLVAGRRRRSPEIYQISISSGLLDLTRHYCRVSLKITSCRSR
jgi:hypothetical protein